MDCNFPSTVVQKGPLSSELGGKKMFVFKVGFVLLVWFFSFKKAA